MRRSERICARACSVSIQARAVAAAVPGSPGGGGSCRGGAARDCGLDGAHRAPTAAAVVSARSHQSSSSSLRTVAGLAGCRRTVQAALLWAVSAL